MASKKRGSIVKREADLSHKQFPFEVIHIGEPANNMETFHWHDFMEISYITEGKGTYYIEDKVFSVQRGDIVIINNIERHKVNYDAEQPLYEIVMHFDPKLIWSEQNSLFDYHYLKLFLYDGVNFQNKLELDELSMNIVSSAISDIVEEYINKKPYFELMMKSKLLTVITLLFRESKVRHIDTQESLVKRSNIERLQKILGFVHENFTSDISLKTVARQFFMNPAYFSDFFKRNIGVNFLDYLIQVRVNEAKRLIDEGEMNSTEIAFQCGFSSIAGFYNAFRRNAGMNPGEYKKRFENTGTTKR